MNLEQANGHAESNLDGQDHQKKESINGSLTNGQIQFAELLAECLVAEWIHERVEVPGH